MSPDSSRRNLIPVSPRFSDRLESSDSTIWKNSRETFYDECLLGFTFVTSQYPKKEWSAVLQLIIFAYVTTMLVNLDTRIRISWDHISRDDVEWWKLLRHFLSKENFSCEKINVIEFSILPQDIFIAPSWSSSLKIILMHFSLKLKKHFPTIFAAEKVFPSGQQVSFSPWRSEMEMKATWKYSMKASGKFHIAALLPSYTFQFREFQRHEHQQSISNEKTNGTPKSSSEKVSFVKFFYFIIHYSKLFLFCS